MTGWLYAAAAGVLVAGLLAAGNGIYRYGRAVERAAWIEAQADAQRIVRAAQEAAERDKATLRSQVVTAQAAARQARGGVEKIDADGAAALEAIR